jgi:hypothetical protein
VGLELSSWPVSASASIAPWLLLFILNCKEKKTKTVMVTELRTLDLHILDLRIWFVA